MERRRDRDLNATRLGAARIDPAVALDLGGRATNSPSLRRSFWRLSRTLFGQPNRLCRSRRACRRKASLAVGKGCQKDKSESFGERVWWLVGELTHVFQNRELRHEPIGLSADVKRDDPAVFLYPLGCWGMSPCDSVRPFPRRKAIRSAFGKVGPPAPKGRRQWLPRDDLVDERENEKSMTRSCRAQRRSIIIK